MPEVRSLNAAGLEKFREFLSFIRSGEALAGSPSFMFFDAYALPLHSDVKVEPRKFKSKLDMVMYLDRLLKPLNRPQVMENEGLWSWLALYWFDQLAPADASGRRRAREDHFYILESSGRFSTGWYRNNHMLAGPYAIFRLHGLTSRVLLRGPLHLQTRMLDDIAWRTELITNRGWMQAVDRLYFNPKTNGQKSGATTASNPGNLRRLIAVTRQLEMTFDLHGMSGDEILALLPPEFDRWKS